MLRGRHGISGNLAEYLIQDRRGEGIVIPCFDLKSTLAANDEMTKYSGRSGISGRFRTKALIEISAASTSLLNSLRERPSVLRPSPEMSMTWRIPSKRFCSIDFAEYNMASATALPPRQREYGKAIILFPKVSAVSFPLISVHSTLRRVQPSAANSIKATAMRPR